MQSLISKIFEIYGNDAPVLEKAYEFAHKAHIDQKRESGEPYIMHPCGVADILIDIGLDFSTVAAAFLHDVIEDTPATVQDIEREFGKEIAELVLGVTKLDKISFKSKAEEQAENFRKMLFAMAKDIRVLLIKLADRLHNMRTISGLPRDRQVAMATETLEIYAPLASRLGLSYIKCELEDLSLKVLHPDVYDELVRNVSQKRVERQETVSQICGTLRSMLKEMEIEGDVSGRPKHFYSIYRKMTTQNRSFDQIYDLTAVRVLVNSVRDCYEVLGMIHTVWKPIPGRFKDYIAVPKPNNYQSLHTTVMTKFGTPFEIQIRTFEMHKIAEYGIAAHWKYKENRMKSNELDNKLGWLRQVMDAQNDMGSSTEFLESLKIDLYSGQVFIFTPKGDVIIMPEGSTPVDFAYHVHSAIGNKCVGAKINSKIVPLETKLKTGDFVEILTSNTSKGPSRDWLKFVKTTQAKAKIRSFFKKEMKEDNIKKGKEMMELEAKHRGYQLNDLLQQKWLEIIMQRFNYSSLEDIYAAIGYGGTTVNQILLKLIEFFKTEQNYKGNEEKKSTEPRRNDFKQGVIIKGYDDLLVRLAKCCNPVPGDSITGFISRGRGIAVHRESCPNLKNVENFRIIEAEWAKTAPAAFAASIQVIADNNTGLLALITKMISDMKLSIQSVNARVDKHDAAIINLSVSVDKINQVDNLIKKMKMLPGVEKVYRTTN